MLKKIKLSLLFSPFFCVTFTQSLKVAVKQNGKIIENSLICHPKSLAAGSYITLGNQDPSGIS